MKNKEINQINAVIDKLSNNTADIAHVKNLFTILRFKNKEVSVFIREVGHFINHDEKDRGIVYKLAKNFIDNVMSLKSGMGGALYTIPLYIKQSELLRQLKASLLHLKFDATMLSKLDGCGYFLMKSVIEILDEATILINSPDIIKCELTKKVSPNNVITLNVRIFPRQTAEQTTLGGPGGITFGPNMSMDADFMQALPQGITQENLGHIAFNIPKQVPHS